MLMLSIKHHVDRQTVAKFMATFVYPRRIEPNPENPGLESNMERIGIGCTVCEIFAFKLYCNLETGVRGH